jgi:hypothetical protein
MDAVAPFTLTIPDSELADLRTRLHATRWPERETVGNPAGTPLDWSQGVPLA